MNSRPPGGSVMQAVRSTVTLLLVFAVFLVGCETPWGEGPVREAERLAEEGRWEEAAEAFRNFPQEVAPWRPFGSWRAASIYRDELKDRIRAEVALADCAKKWSATDWGYVCRVELGHLRILRENHRGAIDAFRGALELRPRGAYAETCLLEAGRAYLALDEPEQARLEWEELLRSFPSTPLAATVALEMARSYDIEGKQREAVAAYRALIERYEGHSVVPEARFGEGESLEQLGQLEEALEVFRLLLHGHPNPEAVKVKVEAVERRIGRRNTNQATIFQRSGQQPPVDWDDSRGVAPNEEEAVGEPTEEVD